jgi:ribosome-associated protein
MEISRSEKKRQLKRVEELVAELAGLPAGVIGKIPCSDEIRRLLLDAAPMKGGARKRHIKYIAKLLRDEPLEEVYTFLSGRKGAALQKKKEFHEIELYRDTLLNEAIEAHGNAESSGEPMEEEWTGRTVDAIRSALPGVDQKQLLRLAALYARTHNRKYSRELFRLLQAAHEQVKRNKTMADMNGEG